MLPQAREALPAAHVRFFRRARLSRYGSAWDRDYLGAVLGTVASQISWRVWDHSSLHPLLTGMRPLPDRERVFLPLKAITPILRREPASWVSTFQIGPRASAIQLRTLQAGRKLDQRYDRDRPHGQGRGPIRVGDVCLQRQLADGSRQRAKNRTKGRSVSGRVGGGVSGRRGARTEGTFDWRGSELLPLLLAKTCLTQDRTYHGHRNISRMDRDRGTSPSGWT
jgi:hypothetical protein